MSSWSRCKAMVALAAVIAVPFAVSERSAADGVVPEVTAPPVLESDAMGDAIRKVPLAIARIFFEYNFVPNDLGVHVFLDGEDWKTMTIEDPLDRLLFSVRGRRGFAQLGMTELFFEGAEPSLSEVPLAELLAKFPEGEYEFSGVTAENEEIEGTAIFSHAVPAAPVVAAQTGPNNLLVIAWSPVVNNPPGFPVRPITITGYQVIVDTFQVTVPANVFSVTVPPEFVATLGPGTHPYEVLAIDISRNQTIREATFTL